MNIVLLGPQGCGKGTQARLLIEDFNFFYFESGAYLRRIADKFPEIKNSMDSGGLIPDKEFTSYLTAYLDEESLYTDVVFDGFPRTLDQYMFLKKWLDDKKVNIDLVLVIKISEEESVRRLGARRQDPITGKIYNLVTEIVPTEIDQTKLVQRVDDTPEAIKKRLGIYKDQTVPLINYLKGITEVHEIDGERSIEKVYNSVLEIVKSKNGN